MYQKALAKQAWTEAGLYPSKDKKLDAFLRYFENAPADCWPQLVNELRDHYPDLKERLVMPLWNTGDKLLRLNIIRAIDPEREDEVKLLQKLIRRTHAPEDGLELHAVVQKDHPVLLDQVARKRAVSPELKQLVFLHQQQISRKRAGKKKAEEILAT